MKKLDYLKIIKIALGSCIAIVLADSIGLKSSAAAGIITLLSIQNTKKETISVAGRRFLSFVVALFIAFVVFRILGNNPVSFGVFLLVFVAVCFICKLEDGISISAVLISHLLAEEAMSYAWIGNELLLLIIGVGIGIILNLYMPRKAAIIRLDQYQVEEEMKFILNKIAATLNTGGKEKQGECRFKELEIHLEEALKRAYEFSGNTLWGDVRYYARYMGTRKTQCLILKRIVMLVNSIDDMPPQAKPMGIFIDAVVESFHESSNAVGMLKKLEGLRVYFKNEPLPVTRNEFENRALLLRILDEMENFLDIKRRFVSSLTQQEISDFWGKPVEKT